MNFDQLGKDDRLEAARRRFEEKQKTLHENDSSFLSHEEKPSTEASLKEPVKQLTAEDLFGPSDTDAFYGAPIAENTAFDFTETLQDVAPVSIDEAPATNDLKYETGISENVKIDFRDSLMDRLNESASPYLPAVYKNYSTGLPVIEDRGWDHLTQPRQMLRPENIFDFSLEMDEVPLNESLDLNEEANEELAIPAALLSPDIYATHIMSKPESELRNQNTSSVMGDEKVPSNDSAKIFSSTERDFIAAEKFINEEDPSSQEKKGDVDFFGTFYPNVEGKDNDVAFGSLQSKLSGNEAETENFGDEAFGHDLQKISSHESTPTTSKVSATSTRSFSEIDIPHRVDQHTTSQDADGERNQSLELETENKSGLVEDGESGADHNEGLTSNQDTQIELSQVKELKARIEELCGAISDQKVEIEENKTNIGNQEIIIEEDKTTIESQKRIIEELKASIDEQKIALEEKDLRNEAQAELVKIREVRIEELEKTAAIHESVVKDLSKQIDELNVKMTQKSSEPDMAKPSETSCGHEIIIQEQSSTIERMKKENTNLKLSRMDLNDRIAELEEELEELKAKGASVANEPESLTSKHLSPVTNPIQSHLMGIQPFEPTVSLSASLDPSSGEPEINTSKNLMSSLVEEPADLPKPVLQLYEPRSFDAGPQSSVSKSPMKHESTFESLFGDTDNKTQEKSPQMIGDTKQSYPQATVTQTPETEVPSVYDLSESISKLELNSTAKPENPKESFTQTTGNPISTISEMESKSTDAVNEQDTFHTSAEPFRDPLDEFESMLQSVVQSSEKLPELTGVSFSSEKPGAVIAKDSHVVNQDTKFETVTDFRDRLMVWKGWQVDMTNWGSGSNPKVCL